MGIAFGAIGMLLFASGIILLIVSIFMKNKKLWFTISGSIVAISVISIIVGVANTDVDELKAEQDKQTTEETKKKKTTVKEQLEDGLKETFDDDQELEVKFDKDKKEATVKAVMSENLTTDWMIDTGLSEAKDTLEVAKDIKEIERVAIHLQTNFVDKYGNKSQDDAFRIFVDRETIDKIEFENFNPENLKEVSDSFYQHPGMN